MSKNQTIIVTIVAGLLLAVVSGFIVSFINLNKNTLATPTNIVLNMDGYTYTLAQMQPIIASYEKANPHIQINYTQLDVNTYKTYLTQRMSGGDTKVVPDIFEAKSTDQDSFIKFTHTIPSTLITPEAFKSTYYPLFSRGLVYNDQSVIGLPVDIDPLFLIGNANMLKSQNTNLTAITTDINSFNSITTQMAKSGKIASINIGVTSDHLSDIVQLLMLENGANMNSTTNPLQAGFNDTRGAQAIEYFQSFASLNGIHKDNWDAQKGVVDTTSFVKGNSALMFGTLEDVEAIEASAPTLPLGFAMYPSLNAPLTLGTYDYDGVYGYSSNPTDAAKFLMYLHSKDVQEKLEAAMLTSNQFGIISPRKDTPFSNSNTSLAQIINAANGVAVDWNYDDANATATVFQTLVTTYSSGFGQSALDLAVKQINTNIQKALNL